MITILNTVSIIPTYVRVPHLELVSPELEFASTSLIYVVLNLLLVF